jgi:hypothetical protein
MTDYLFDLLVDYLVLYVYALQLSSSCMCVSPFVFLYYRLLLLFRCLIHQHQPAAVPVIIDEADKDILLDAQRPCYVKNKITASAAVTIGDVTKPMTGKEKKKIDPPASRQNFRSSSAKRSRHS